MNGKTTEKKNKENTLYATCICLSAIVFAFHSFHCCFTCIPVHCGISGSEKQQKLKTIARLISYHVSLNPNQGILISLTNPTISDLFFKNKNQLLP